MDFWETWTFADLLAKPVRNGIYKKKEFHGRGQKMVNMGELFSYDFISDQEMKRIELNDRELANYLVKDGDLLFARRSFVLEGSGKCSLVVQPSEDTTFESSIIRARPNPDWVDPRFYYYLFRSPQGRALISSIATRTAVSGIRGSELALLKVPKPPLPTQRKIATVLSTYDDLIENNTRRIEILEEMARAIYREWFVEFRFPGYKKVPMVESELGLIPQGWEVKQLSEMCHVIMGLSPKSEFYNDTGDGLPFHQGVADFGKRFPMDRVYCTIQKRIAEADDILFSVRAPVGRINIANKKIVIGRGLSAIRSKEGNQAFLLQQLKDRFQKEDTMGSGAIFNAIRKTDLLRIPLLTPTESVIGKFEEIVNPIFAELANLTLKNINLRQTRDLLLPKLISGELDVSKLDVDTDKIEPRVRGGSKPVSVDRAVAH